VNQKQWQPYIQNKNIQFNEEEELNNIFNFHVLIPFDMWNLHYSIIKKLQPKNLKERNVFHFFHENSFTIAKNTLISFSYSYSLSSEDLPVACSNVL